MTRITLQDTFSREHWKTVRLHCIGIGPFPTPELGTLQNQENGRSVSKSTERPRIWSTYRTELGPAGMWTWPPGRRRREEQWGFHSGFPHPVLRTHSWVRLGNKNTHVLLLRCTGHAALSCHRWYPDGKLLWRKPREHVFDSWLMWFMYVWWSLLKLEFRSEVGSHCRGHLPRGQGSFKTQQAWGLAWGTLWYISFGANTRRWT